MTALVAVVVLTLGISAICSLLEAMILSTTATDIELLKKRDAARGALLEDLRRDIGETSSSILALNTVANTLGAVLVGGLATQQFGEAALGVVSGVLTFGILVFSEILPKNLGVHYRRLLQPVAIYLLSWIRQLMKPVTFLTNRMVKSLVQPREEAEGQTESEIILLAEKGAQEGELEASEVRFISNALSLSSVKVRDIMTPRTVVIGAQEDEMLKDLLHRVRTIRFARMPVYVDTIDNVTGMVRRRDILHSIAVGEGSKRVGDLKMEATFFPEFLTASDALENLLAGHQQMGMVVDEFGSFVGVITIEDIVEHLIGKEIYERDDVAVDMRELARLKSKLIGLHK